MGEHNNGIMMMAPCYENTAMELNMRDLHDHSRKTR